MRRTILITLLGTVVYVSAAGANGRTFSIISKANFTTGAQLFPTPQAADPFQRASSVDLEDIFGVGLEVVYHLPEVNLAVGLSADYVRTTGAFIRRLSSVLSVPVEDGYRVIPVEITGYFMIPIAGPTWGVYMGGGGGAYFGRRIYRFAEVDAVPTDHGHGFGIHVLGGLSYRFTEWFSVQAEMKFRDLQFDATNTFPVDQTTYEGVTISLPQPGRARIHADGMVFQLGTAFTF